VLEVLSFERGPLPNNVYLLVDRDRAACAVVDPGIGCEDLLDHIADHAWTVEIILNTHAHFDHVYNNALFARATGAPIALHPEDVELLHRLRLTCESYGFPLPEPSPSPSILLEHGGFVEVAGNVLEVRHTPGHCPGQVAFIFPGHAVVGDTLFHRAVGRWDLPGGDFEALERSILEQLYPLPEETKVWPGHFLPTTIGEEKQFNPYVGAGARLKVKY
jgi:hydroxyacylglutathione hydrolase